MKNRRLIALLTLMLAAFTMLAVSCAAPEPVEPTDFESFIESNPELRDSIDNNALSQDSDITYEIKGNDIIYTYDMSSMEGMTEDVVKSDIVTEALEAGLEDQADSFKALANSLSSLSEIEGIKVIVNYKYGDEIILTETYEADPLPQAEEESE